MPFDIEAVLALLPELFAGVQKIPLKNIQPNPENPGPPLSSQAIADLAANLAERGLVNPIKVQLNRAQPLAGGVQPHPANPRLTQAGRPWELGDFNFMLLAGERRFRAAASLGWGSIPGFILNPTAEEAVEITHLDNDVRDRGWWAGWQSIEQLIRANPKLTQRQVGAKLKMDFTKVNRALRFLPLLNPQARDLIVANSNNSEGKFSISESAVLRLAELGPDSTLKPGARKKEGASEEEVQRLWPYPPLPSHIQDLVYRSLQVAINQQMTEAKMRGLVAWVQEGHAPEEFPPKPSQSPADPQPSQGEGQPSPAPAARTISAPILVDPQRVRLHPFIPDIYFRPIQLERMVLSMQALPYVEDVLMRPLSAKEKEKDPQHDYEAYWNILILEAAKKLGWPQVRARVENVDPMEAKRLNAMLHRVSQPLSWVEVYLGIKDILETEPGSSVESVAIAVGADPYLAKKLMTVLKLFNDAAVTAIVTSIHSRRERGIDMGGHRFDEWLALPLARLENLNQDLAQTQKIVQEMVEFAIENEMYEDEMEELVDWVLQGHKPSEFYVEEA